MKTLLLAGTAAIVALAFVAGTAEAQEAAATIATTPEAAPQTAPENGLADIIVTAQRRSENLQKSAIAVSAVAGDTLTKQSITQANDLTRLIPSLQVAPAASFTQIYLRGVGTFGANAFAEQGVAFNVDGVYLSRPAAPAGLFYDLERIEVLKGPQGTLYGRNATGGAVNLITKKPKLNETSGFINAEYGNYDAIKGSAAINLPVGSHVALRVAGQYSKHDGYFNDGYDDENTKAIRGQIYAETGTGFDATFSVDYADVGGKGSGGTIMPLLFGKGDARLGPSDPRVLAAYLGVSPTFPVPQVVANDRGFQNNKFLGLSATINADLGFAKLTVIPAYRKTNLDFESYASSFLIDVVEKSDQMSLETRLASQTGPLNWVLGGYYFAEHVNADQSFNQGSNGTKIKSRLQTESFAAFGQATYSLTDRFRVTGGLRYTKDNKKQDTVAATLPFVGFVPGVFPLQPIILSIPTIAKSDVDFKKVTWKAGVEFDLGSRSLLYASVATGFKSGALFSAVGRNYSQPENLRAYTVGSKNRFFDNRLQLNVEAFWWDYKDQQISHLGPVQVAVTPGGTIYGPVFVTENAGAATIKGIEAELLFQPTPADQISANIQYLDAKYNDLRYQAYSTTGPAPVIGCAVTPSALIGASAAARIYNVDCSGRPVVNAPKWSVNLGYERKFELNGNGRFIFGADTRIETSRFLSIDFLELGRQGSYTMSNARLTYETESGNLSLTGFVNNIENEIVFSNSFQSPAKTGVIYNQLRPPRTYGARASFRF